MPDQLQLELEPASPNPNAHMFNADGSMKRLCWCSDSVRIAWRKGEDLPCPYLGEKARFRPAGGCCKDIEGAAA